MSGRGGSGRRESGHRPRDHRRRELGILAWYCGIGAVVLGCVAASGILVPRSLWVTVGAALLGGWVGLAIYRLRSDAVI